jgi:hypothetical protein
VDPGNGIQPNNLNNMICNGFKKVQKNQDFIRYIGNSIENKIEDLNPKKIKKS